MWFFIITNNTRRENSERFGVCSIYGNAVSILLPTAQIRIHLYRSWSSLKGKQCVLLFEWQQNYCVTRPARGHQCLQTSPHHKHPFIQEESRAERFQIRVPSWCLVNSLRTQNKTKSAHMCFSLREINLANKFDASMLRNWPAEAMRAMTAHGLDLRKSKELCYTRFAMEGHQPC
jgi:hypothetical protein